MLSCLQIWNPSLPLNLSRLRKAYASKGKITWDEELEDEYINCMEIMKTRINISPYDPKKRLRLIIDGAKTIGTGFVLCKQKSKDNQGNWTLTRTIAQ